MTATETNWRCTRPEELRQKRTRLANVFILTTFFAITCAFAAKEAVDRLDRLNIETQSSNPWPYGFLFLVFFLLFIVFAGLDLLVCIRIKEVNDKLNRWAAAKLEKPTA